MQAEAKERPSEPSSSECDEYVGTMYLSVAGKCVNVCVHSSTQPIHVTYYLCFSSRACRASTHRSSLFNTCKTRT
jgi:hypothetical protein